MLRFLREEHVGDAGIVYCLARNTTEAIGAFLEQHGIAAVAYPAGLAGAARCLH